MSADCAPTQLLSEEEPLYKYVDLFAGCGGLSLGIERSGGELQLAVEKSDMAAHTFYRNFIDESISGEEWLTYVKSSVEEQGAHKVVVRTLREVLDSDGIMDKLIEDGVDVVVGGPPCQGFSLAGRRNPDDIRNTLPWEYLEFVERTNPRLVVIENVVGMNHKFAEDQDAPFVQLQQALRETGLGYLVQGVAVNAVHFGAPQNRPRLMIIGLRTDYATEIGATSSGDLWTSSFLDEMKGDSQPVLAPIPVVTREQSPTVADAIGDLQQILPIVQTKRARVYRSQTKTRVFWGLPKPGKAFSNTGIPNQAPRKHAVTTQTRFRLYQWLRDNNLQPRLLSQLSSDQEGLRSETLKRIAEGAFPATAPDGTVLAADPAGLLELMVSLSTRKHTQKALAWDQPARTVVTLPDDYVHPSEPRIFTVREMARFQGFPDDFVFVGKETTGSLRRRFEVPQYSQVGNAVSPFLAFAVGQMVDRVLATNATLTEAEIA